MSRNAVVGDNKYRPAWWLPGGHLQTLWGKFGRGRVHVETTRELLETADGDKLELHHLAGAPHAPRVLLLHGLEGSRTSHYVGGMLAQAKRRRWGATLLLFRGCSDTPNSARRFYHSGETTDLDHAASTLLSRNLSAVWFIAGVSLGANVLLKWMGERGAHAQRIRAAAAVSTPFDLEAGARKISKGFSRIYDRSFLRSLKRKARRKLATYPDLFDDTRLGRARNVFEFDESVTAPVHGFVDAIDYYSRSSSIHFLESIRSPTLLLSAENDPFLPSSVLDRVREVVRSNPALTVEFVARGGHVGFVEGVAPWRASYYAERRVFEFFDSVLEQGAGADYD